MKVCPVRAYTLVSVHVLYVIHAKKSFTAKLVKRETVGIFIFSLTSAILDTYHRSEQADQISPFTKRTLLQI